MFRRLYFTLLELLVVIAIVGSLAGIIGINVTYAIREQRFRSEVDLVVDQLRLAQDLMLIFHANINVVVTLTEERNGFFLELLPKVSLPSPWLKEVSRKRHLRYIQHFNFTGLEREVNQLELKFLSGGSEMSQGVIRLSTHEIDGPGVLTRYIVLPGHPAPISITDDLPNLKDRSEENYNKEITFRTVEAINAKKS